MLQNWGERLVDFKRLSSQDKQTVPILQDLLAGRETAEGAASRVAEAYEKRIRNGNNRTPGGLWLVFCTAVDHYGADEDVRNLLVELLLRLADIDVLDAEGKPVPSDLNDDTFWRQLPGYSLAFRDNLQRLTLIEYITEDEWEDERRRFHNFNVFQATWLGRVNHKGPERERLSAQNYALWDLSEALDCGIPNTKLGLSRTKIYIPQAAEWMFIAGHVVYQLCRENAKNDGSPANERCQGDDAVDGFLYTGPEGFSLDRWSWWKERFSQIAALEGVEPEVKQLAASAAEKMDAIEKSG